MDSANISSMMCTAIAIEWCDEGITYEPETVKTRCQQEGRTDMEDFYSISRQEGTQFRPKYSKAMSRTNSTPRQ